MREEHSCSPREAARLSSYLDAGISPESKRKASVMNDTFYRCGWQWDLKAYPTAKDNEVIIQVTRKDTSVVAAPVDAEAFAAWARTHSTFSLIEQAITRKHERIHNRR